MQKGSGQWPVVSLGIRAAKDVREERLKTIEALPAGAGSFDLVAASLSRSGH
jgi:hypothetical protein